jgi:cellulose synthase/poly-beta-1,6-N-acetylglucosamine synthase-like glycosyltransferase
MDLHDPREWIFTVSLVALAYTFVGYPILIGLLSRLFPRPINRQQPAVPPSVSVVLVAFNEAARIRSRIENLLSSDYPPQQLEIIVVTDGSEDDTPLIVGDYSTRSIRLLKREQRSGKAACLNAGVPVATGDIVVFCDARQRFNAATIPALVANFSDPQLGAVSGELFIESSSSSVGGGVDLYWKLEKFIRESESRFSSVIGATGAVYAIRRALFSPIPEDTLLDDVVIPMQIAMQGHRVGFDSAAPAFDPQTTDPASEKRRKKRTLAGNYQMLFRHPGWLLPWRTGLWWQVISHKYSRVTAPVFMLAMFISNAQLIDKPVFRYIFWAHCVFYALAFLGGLLPNLRLRLLSIPSGFVFLNLMMVGGFWNYLRGTYRQGKW